MERGGKGVGGGEVSQLFANKVFVCGTVSVARIGPAKDEHFLLLCRGGVGKGGAYTEKRSEKYAYADREVWQIVSILAQ